MQQLVLRILRWTFRLGGLIAPDFTASQAFKLFRTPRARQALKPDGRRLLDSAERFEVAHGEGSLQVFRWRPAGVAQKRTPAVLLVHGWESRAARLGKWVEPLLARGFGVVAFDAPAHGESEGRRSSLPDFVHAIAHVAAVAGPFDAIVGHSLGAVTTALAVAGSHLSGLPPVRAEKMVLLASADRAYDVFARFADLVGLNDRVFARFLDRIEEIGGQPVEAYSVASVLAKSNIPTLLFHDRDDQEIPHTEVEAIAAAAPTVTLVSSEGLGHHRIVRDTSTIERGIAFLADGVTERAVA